MNRLAFAILAATMFLSMVGFGLIVPLLPLYALRFGASHAEVGMIFAVTSLVNFLFLPLMGPLSDRMGRKWFLCIGLFLLSVSCFGFIVAGSVMQLLMLRALQGLAMSFHLPVAQALLGDMTPPGEEGRWMGYFNAIMFSGLGAGPLIGGMLNDFSGAHAVFGFSGAAMLLSLLVTWVCLKEPQRRHEQARSRRWHEGVHRNRALLALLLLQVCGGLMTGMSMAFIPILATEKLALSSTAIGLVLAIRTPISLLQSWSGKFADSHDRKLQIIIGSLIAVSATMAMPVSGSLAGLLCANALLSVGVVVSQPAASAYVVEQGRVMGMGAAMSLFLMAMQLGGAVGPIAAGWIMNWGGFDTGFYAAGAINVLGIVMFALLMRGVPGHRRAAVAETRA